MFTLTNIHEELAITRFLFLFDFFVHNLYISLAKISTCNVTRRTFPNLLRFPIFDYDIILNKKHESRL